MKKITTVGFLFAILLAVALGVHHLAFAQSGSYSPAWVPPTWSNALQSPILTTILNGQTPASIPRSAALPDPTGRIGSYQPGGATTTSKNAFFTSTLGTNQRTCFSCHQPQDGWTITPRTVQSIYLNSHGLDALFQPVDGSNCPDLGAAAPYFGSSFVAARSQLFNKANIRIFLPVPEVHDWVQLRVENDPYGCEKSVIYGVPAGFLSMYRRPLPSANLFFLDPAGTTVPAPPNPPFPPIPGLSGVSPEGTGFAIMWDSREPDLPTQFQDAVRIHAQATPAQIAALTSGAAPNDVQQGVSFQQGIFTAQSFDQRALDLTGGHDGSGATGGAAFLASLSCSDIINCLPVAPTFFGAPQFTLYPPTFFLGSGSERAQRASILRGQAMFNGGVTFIVNGVSGFNDVLGPNFQATCNTCHNVQNVGNNFVLPPLHTGIGDNSYLSPLQAPAGFPPLPPTPDLPLFGFLCPTGSIPFFSNQVTVNGATYDLFETTDPGTGLITGKCADLGKMKTPILRGLASRAPYFHGGNASSLQDLVNFYDQRFSIGLTPQQKTDLINFLNTL
jgi:cytochrome c peroxidase